MNQQADDGQGVSQFSDDRRLRLVITGCMRDPHSEELLPSILQNIIIHEIKHRFELTPELLLLLKTLAH